MLDCCGGAEGPQEASLTFLDQGEQREAQRGEEAALRSHSRKGWSLSGLSQSQVGGSQGLVGERPRRGGSAEHPPTHCARYYSKKRPRKRHSVQRHTHRDPRDRKSGRRRPRRQDQTKDARQRGEQSRAAGAGVELGWV